MFEKNYIEDVLSGTAELEEIDKYVDFWHSHDTGNTLREFLGMAPDEYEEWMKQGNVVLRDILRCRMDMISFSRYLAMPTEERIAARSYSIEQIKNLADQNKHGN